MRRREDERKEEKVSQLDTAPVYRVNAVWLQCVNGVCPVRSRGVGFKWKVKVGFPTSEYRYLIFPKLYVSAAAFSNWGSGRGSRDATNSSGLD